MPGVGLAESERGCAGWEQGVEATAGDCAAETEPKHAGFGGGGADCEVGSAEAEDSECEPAQQRRRGQGGSALACSIDVGWLTKKRMMCARAGGGGDGARGGV
eukprot:578506-Rhodomonas_salina.4